MPTLPPGPHTHIDCPNGNRAPFYMLPFDKRGICEAPETRRRLVESAADGVFTDIFVFSHGWNNDWSSATTGYKRFIHGFLDMVRRHQLAMPEPFRPLLIGIHWPSAALVLTDEEVGPEMAAAHGADDSVLDAMTSRLRDLADQLEPDAAARFYALLQQESLDEDQALELAALIQPLYSPDDEVAQDEPVSPEEIRQGWFEAAGDESDTSGGFGDFGAVDDPGAGPTAAGGAARKLDPRQVVRMLTVFQMKDRAGVVGAHGVGSLLRDLLAAGQARIHTVGHSYGCRVMLSAAAFGNDLPRPLESMLLLQPALSHLSFADVVPGTNRPGGYRPALSRVNLPILSTYSENDLPLHKLFHLILRRGKDLGEARIAAAPGGPPPSRYAALGGYGPRRCDERLVEVLDPGTPYELQGAIMGIHATRTVGGHNDYSNDSTWWALYNLVNPAS